MIPPAERDARLVARYRHILVALLALFVAAELLAVAGVAPEPLQSVWGPSGFGQFFAMALLGTFALHLWCGPPRREALATLALALIFELGRIAVEHALGWEARAIALSTGFGAGLASLTVLAIVSRHAVERRVILLAGLIVPLAVLLSNSLVQLTTALHPLTLDALVYAFDGSLGLQPSFVVGRLFARLPTLARVSEVVYLATPFGFALLWAAQRRSRAPAAVDVMTAFLVATGAGFALYHAFPVAGPIYVVGNGWPEHPPSLADMGLSPGYAQPVARNCMPSLHTTWVLLLAWHSRGRGLVVRAIAFVFLTFTLLATLGEGLHYLTDLVVAVPFALAAQAASAPASPSRRRIFVVAALAMVAWLVLLRWGVLVRAPSLPLSWLLVGVTVVAGLLLERRLHAASVRAVETAQPAPLLTRPHRRWPWLAAGGGAALALVVAPATVSVSLPLALLAFAVGAVAGERAAALSFARAAGASAGLLALACALAPWLPGAGYVAALATGALLAGLARRARAATLLMAVLVAAGLATLAADALVPALGVMRSDWLAAAIALGVTAASLRWAAAEPAGDAEDVAARGEAAVGARAEAAAMARAGFAGDARGDAADGEAHDAVVMARAGSAGESADGATGERAATVRGGIRGDARGEAADGATTEAVAMARGGIRGDARGEAADGATSEAVAMARGGSAGDARGEAGGGARAEAAATARAGIVGDARGDASAPVRADGGAPAPAQLVLAGLATFAFVAAYRPLTAFVVGDSVYAVATVRALLAVGAGLGILAAAAARAGGGGAATVRATALALLAAALVVGASGWHALAYYFATFAAYPSARGFGAHEVARLCAAAVAILPPAAGAGAALATVSDGRPATRAWALFAAAGAVATVSVAALLPSLGAWHAARLAAAVAAVAALVAAARLPRRAAMLAPVLAPLALALLAAALQPRSLAAAHIAGGSHVAFALPPCGDTLDSASDAAAIATLATAAVASSDDAGPLICLDGRSLFAPAAPGAALADAAAPAFVVGAPPPPGFAAVDSLTPSAAAARLLGRGHRDWHLRVGDVRAALAAAPGRYDLISIARPTPLAPADAALLSRDLFAVAARALSPRGRVAVALPLAHVSPRVLAAIFGGARAVFADVALQLPASELAPATLLGCAQACPRGGKFLNADSLDLYRRDVAARLRLTPDELADEDDAETLAWSLPRAAVGPALSSWQRNHQLLHAFSGHY